MIFVNRSAHPVPPSLGTQTAQLAKKKIIEALTRSDSAHLSQLSFRFDSKLWIDAKRALWVLFNGKCAYCESKVADDGYGYDVEHFRPKQGAQDLSGAEGQHLHYAWLAYEWENLLLACPACNRTRRGKGRVAGKGSRFPVTGPRAPLGASITKCRTIERETLLDPCYDRPAEHLSFDPNGGCVADSKRGALTIEVLDLNRSDLVSGRRLVMAAVSDSIKAIFARNTSSRTAVNSAVGAAADAIAAMVRPDAQFAAAARAQLELECGGRPARPWPSYGRARIVSALRSLRTAKRPAVVKAAPVIAAVLHTALLQTPLLTRFRGRRELPPCAYRTLSRIEITNFKALENISITFPDPSPDLGDQASALMLLGENAAGKSTILEALALALVGTTQIRKLGIDGKDYLRRDENWKLVGEPARVRLTLTGDTEPAIDLTIDARSGVFSGPSTEQMVLLGYGPRRFFSNTKGQRRQRGTAARLKTLFDPTAIITNPTAWLMNSSDHDYDAAVRALRQLLLLEEASYVARPPRGQRAGQEIVFKFEGKSTPLKRLSEGYRTVVATGVDVMREMLEFWPNLELAQGVVLIDELDTHLHPRWKMRILERLRSAMPRVQFICTTHDPLCLRGLFEGEVQVLQRLEGSPIEQVLDLPNVQGLTVEQLLTSDYFGLMSTEDPRVEADLVRYVALATKKHRSVGEEEELELHRDTARRRIRLGSSPQEQLLVETANALVVKQRKATTTQRAGMRQKTAKKMLDIWSSIDKKLVRA